VVEGRNPTDGIVDYDIIYFDPDQSREAEEVVNIRAQALFQDLNIKIQIKNQSRVHMWYEPKFGLPYPELKSATESLHYYPSKVQAIALQGRRGSRISFDAPFGFENILRMVVRPNRALEFPDVYEAKIKRWKDVWPTLKVYPWKDGK
jgi:hypothetical protein